MQLPPDQVERFYALWRPLILFVNQRLRVEPTMLHAKEVESWDPQKVLAIRDALWANDPLRDAFIAENPAKLSDADLAIVASWSHRVAGEFCIYRHLKKHSILIKGEEVYAVLGLASTLNEVVPFTPCFAKTVVLPFEEQIIYDSLLVAYNVWLGPGIRRNLADIYKDARERGAIITSLLPHAPDRQSDQASAGAVNAKVLDAFRQYLFAKGLSAKVAERDLTNAGDFGEYLAGGAVPSSLRDFAAKQVRDYLKQLASAGFTASQRKQHLTGLTRFARFLRDTGRTDPDTGDSVLEILKGKA